MKTSKLLFFAAGLQMLVFAFCGQSTRPVTADGTVALQRVSYSLIMSSASGAPARTKKIRSACYPVGGECTKDSDCCTGYCRVGRVTAYCDYN